MTRPASTTCHACGHSADTHATPETFTGRACYGFMGMHAGSYVCPCDRLRGQYIAGWNQPGYLPETDPETFDSFEDAVESLSADLTDQMLEFGDPTRPFYLEVHPDEGHAYCFYLGYVYWVMPSI